MTSVSSILSTVAFVLYLVLPARTGAPRSDYIVLYYVGIGGLILSEVCQILGVLILIGRWFSRSNPQRKVRELLVLVVSLCPYVPTVLLVITVIAYLRARRQNPASARTQAAKRKVEEKFANAAMDAGSNAISSAAESTPPAPPPLPYPAQFPSKYPPQYAGPVRQGDVRAVVPVPSHARPTLRDAVNRVVGPSTGKSLSESPHGLVAVSMVGMLLATVATAGVVVPTTGLVPRLNPASSALAGQVRLFSTQLGNSGPNAITVGLDGNLWFTEVQANQIGHITTSGAIQQSGGIPTAGDLEGITAGPDGALWFTEAAASKIGRITTGGAIQEYSLPLNSESSGITAGPDGALWFTEPDANKIGRITTSGVVQEFNLPEQLSRPVGITAGPDDALWFTESGDARIGRITTGGAIQEFSVTTNSRPVGITAGPDGALWFTEAGANKIGRITTGGAIHEFSIPTASSQPLGITKGPDGVLWFTEAGANKIGRITTGGVIQEYSAHMGGPVGIVAGPDGNLWFVGGANLIGVITP